jgi:hypothetical protein
MSKDKVKDIGFTAEERKLCIKALMSYQEIGFVYYHTFENGYLPFLPPSDEEKKVIDLLIDDFKGPSWENKDG